MSDRVIIGADGGGTQTVLVAVNEDGDVLARCAGAGTNFNTIGMEKARENLVQAIDQLMVKARATSFHRLYIGMSALDVQADEHIKTAFCGDLLEPDKVEMWSDAYMALTGHTLGQPGLIVISGTGSLVMLRDIDGQIHLRAGWGYLLDDKGSSYYLAKKGFEAAVAHWEGDAYGEGLAQAVMDRYALQSQRELISRLYWPAAEPSRLAQFATSVIDLAREGDVDALHIVDEGLSYLAQQAVLLSAHLEQPPVVGLYGGLFQHNPWILRRFEQLLGKRRGGMTSTLISLPPEYGCIIQYYLDEGLLTPQRVSKLKEAVS